jgi:hypothetical protein
MIAQYESNSALHKIYSRLIYDRQRRAGIAAI